MKKSATSRNIAAINRNIQSIAKIFGTESRMYEKAVADIMQFEHYTNKAGITKIRDTKANRAKHSQIRARRNRSMNVNAMKRKAEKALKDYNTKHPKSRIKNIKDFERRIKQQEDLDSVIYGTDERFLVLLEQGVIKSYNYDRHKAYIDTEYRLEKLHEVEQLEQAAELDAVQNKERNIQAQYDAATNQTYVIDADTGEIIYNF